ncbi:hypothetical protein N9937_00210 [bacterium]|nr:hypothetical protein [bacterium]
MELRDYTHITYCIGEDLDEILDEGTYFVEYEADDDGVLTTISDLSKITTILLCNSLDHAGLFVYSINKLTH